MGAVFIFIGYQIVMLYGIGSLAAYFCWRPPRHIPQGEFAVLGVCLPIAGWLLSFAYRPFCFVTALSLGVLFFRYASVEKEVREQEDAESEDLLRGAEEAIAQDPGNAMGYVTKGEVLEKRRDWHGALKAFETAHKLSDRTVSAPELDEIRQRLQDAALLTKGKPSKPAWASAYQTMTVVEKVFIGVGAALCLLNYAMGINVASVMLFVHWCKKDPDPV